MKNSPKLFAAALLASALSLTACQPPNNTNNPPQPSATPTPAPSADPTPTPSPTAEPSPTPTPTSEPSTSPAPGDDVFFTAALTGSQEVPSVSTSASGSARLHLNPLQDTVTIQVTTSGLSGPITGAHLHSGIAGQNGPVVKGLQIRGDVVTGTWRENDNQMPLTDSLRNALLNGELYVNIHTAAHPDGEIRGQVTRTNDRVYAVYLSPDQEVPPVFSGASGAATVRVRPDRSAVTINGYAHDLSGGITGAHVHMGAQGSNGDVVKPLIVENNRFHITWSKNDAENPLTDELLEELEASGFYINVHTSRNPDGEIRGQIMPTAALSVEAKSHFTSELLAQNEVPAVNEDGYGAVDVELDAERDTLTLEAKVPGLTGPITGAHIHTGAAGSNGAVVKALTVNGEMISGTWERNDTEFPFTEELLTDLLNGNLYVNVHTDAHPGGEIRGQLMSTQNEVYTVHLRGNQEVPAVNTDATGAARIMLSADRRSVMVNGRTHELSGPITGAHIHRAPVNLSGPIVKPLLVNGNDFSVNWTTTDTADPLLPSLISQLLNDELYINVHTNAHPNGEIRGQISE